MQAEVCKHAGMADTKIVLSVFTSSISTSVRQKKVTYCTEIVCDALYHLLQYAYRPLLAKLVLLVQSSVVIVHHVDSCLMLFQR